MIDLRSDTVTRPSPAMRRVMAEAEVGDDVWGDDPTVNRFQSVAAEFLGKEAALFLPSTTQANLAAVMSHCGRGDEYLVGLRAHSYAYEAGGAAVLAGVQPQTIPMFDDGRLDLAAAAAAVKPDDPHFPRTRLLWLENTHDGMALPLAFGDEAAAVARDHGLGLHLDGARINNAAVALGVSTAEVAAPFDTVSMCLSKGLGAPFGSVLAGSAELIARAVRARKILGGALRQSGILAAAGLYALDHNVDRLADDHANAAALADGLRALGLEATNNTNMVFTAFGDQAEAVVKAGADADILINVGPDGGSRLVTHLDVSSDDIDTVVRTIGSALGR